MNRPGLLAVAIVVALSSMAGGADAPADLLDGSWLATSAEFAGTPFSAEMRKAIKLEIKGAHYTVAAGKALDRGICETNPAATPKALDITGTEGLNKGKTYLAIYERDGDTLRICYDLSGQGRPLEFKSPPNTKLFLVEYRLAKQ